MQKLKFISLTCESMHPQVDFQHPLPSYQLTTGRPATAWRAATVPCAVRSPDSAGVRPGAVHATQEPPEAMATRSSFIEIVEQNSS